MALSPEQVLALAPDASAASAGRKLAIPSPWKDLGRSARAVWGVCRGSADYQVRADLRDLASKCSCPSRKLPCKHALGLLLLAAQERRLSEASEPEWVLDWMERREAAQQKSEAKRSTRTEREVDVVAQEKRAARREGRVSEGVAQLDRFLADVVQNGIGTLERDPGTLEEQARRLVDAQAPGLAGWMRRLAEIPGSGPDWPERLLVGLGRMALCTEAWSRIDTLDPALAIEVRRVIGWSDNRDDVLAHGDVVEDTWHVVAQQIDDEDRLRIQRSWLVGAREPRAILVLQAAPGMQPFPEPIVPGTCFRGALAMHPGAARRRASIVRRDGDVEPIGTRLPGHASIATMLDEVAGSLARTPFIERFTVVLTGVRPARTASAGLALVDATGAALALSGGAHARLLACSGGAPIDVAAEWDGRVLTPLAVLADGAYVALPGASS